MARASAGSLAAVPAYSQIPVTFLTQFPLTAPTVRPKGTRVLELTPRLQSLVGAIALTRGFPVWARYAITTVLVLLAFSVRVSLLGDGYVYLTFFPAIVLTALLFDRGNGVWATLLSAGIVEYALIPPAQVFVGKDPVHLPALVIFLVSGVGIAILLETMHVFIEALVKAHARALGLTADLQNADRAKDVLLDEVMHRTQNELAMLTSLLELQSRSTEDPLAKQAIASAAARAHVLGRVHERLTRRGNEAVVDLSRFLGDLCNDIRMSLLGLQAISLRTELPSYFIGIDKAVPIGMILNELLTNSIKYAFPEDRPGVIKVRLFEEDQKLCLWVGDNGVGLACAPKTGTGLGQRLIRALASQLQGSLETKEAEDGGTECVVCFPLDAVEQARDPAADTIRTL
jgi:two-component sensor histidine kinase